VYRFPPKEKASIAGELIEYVVAGAGPAQVVLVNGSGGPIEGWHKVFEPLTRFATVFAYNRPGIGGSTGPGKLQTASHMVASLKRILETAGMRGPYVLVGHSLGGLIVNLFARVHASAAAAVVLVEASAPKDVLVLRKRETTLQRFLGRVARKIAPPHPYAETEQVEASVSELQAAPPFPHVPLIVIAGAKPALSCVTAREAVALRAEHQKELAKLSPLGKYVVARRSGHFPQLTEPEVVVAAVEEASRPSPT
jgi:pimeloyl-ACP methyl ester carboxylesterase